jgi:hypothetical protein
MVVEAIVVLVLLALAITMILVAIVCVAKLVIDEFRFQFARWMYRKPRRR